MTDKKWTTMNTGEYNSATRIINGQQYIISYKDMSYGVLQKYDYALDTLIYVGVGAVSTLKKKALAMSK